MTLKATNANVQTPYGKTENFQINAGISQGDGISATLVNLARDYIPTAENK